MERNHRPELRNTASRFSLTNRVVRSDCIHINRLNHNESRRVVSCNKSGRFAQYRQLFLQEGIVLGTQVGSDAEQDHFEVPLESRPLALEARTGNGGELTFGDKRLITELGVLTGTVHRLTEGLIIDAIDAERAFAIVDFVPVNERQLYLLPGAEQLLREAPNGDVLSDQMAAFSKEFGERFSGFTDDFLQGYVHGIGVQR